VLDYGKDTTNNALSVPQLTQLFLDIKARTGAQSIHVIAHSMGNQAFTRALAALQTDAAVPILKQVILAAPDIDQTIFETQIAPAITSKAERVTVYASDKDHALIASAQIYGSYPRVGLIADGDIVRASGVDVIDVSRVDAGWLGWVSLNHSAYGDELIDDVFLLLRHGHEPAGRNLVHEGGAEHWTLLR
jgi:esterase/lipase superfamily enzyme